MKADLPSGTLTFLFTDVVGSTTLWESSPDAMGPAMARHDTLIESAVSSAGGTLVRPRGEGDSRFAVFTSAPAAVDAAVAVHRSLDRETWRTPRPIQVRIAMHTGESELRAGDYYGRAVNRCARLRSIAHAGQILASEATIAACGAALGAQVAVRDLGLHRLRDIAEPEHVFQVAEAGQEADFPPPSSIRIVNLPRPVDRFHGRQDEVETLRNHVLNGQRLITLTGPGGTGKSRLAVEVAAAIASEFPEGVHWIGLSAVRDPTAVITSVATALGTSETELASVIAEDRILLVLDNLEQVLDAAPDIVRLLHACPNLTVFVTSREELGTSGELRYPVAPLGQDDAVALFCERSHVDPSIEVTELCRRLDRLPLAIELAAARCRSLSPRQILERLSTRLDLRAGRGFEPRQRTLRATIDWSYELLSPDEQSLFTRMAVFVGGCTLEAAEAVLSASADDLDSLVSKSLLTGTDERFSMLETVRDYALERLAENPEIGAATEAAFADWALSIVEVENERVRGPQQLQALAILDRERDNIHASFEILLRRVGPDDVRRFTRSAAWWMGRRGEHRELRRWLQSALAGPGGNAIERGWTIACLAEVVDVLGEWDVAERLCAEAAELATAIGDEALLATIEEKLAQHADGPTAEHLFAKAAATFERLDLTDHRARVMINVGATALNQRDYVRAQSACRQAVELVRRQGNRHGIAVALMNLAIALAIENRDDEARSTLAQAIDGFDTLGDEFGQTCAVLVAALLDARAGRFSQAAALGGAAESGRERLGMGIEPSEADLTAWIAEALRDADADLVAEWHALGAARGAAELAVSWRADLL